MTHVSSKHQVTLPVDALREAHVRAGDQLRVTVEGRGQLMLTLVRDPLDDLIGSAPGLSAAADLQRLRDEWPQ